MPSGGDSSFPAIPEPPAKEMRTTRTRFRVARLVSPPRRLPLSTWRKMAATGNLGATKRQLFDFVHPVNKDSGSWLNSISLSTMHLQNLCFCLPQVAAAVMQTSG